MSILALENVTYMYKNAQKAAVLKASCVFEEGKVYAIIGPSGSGKSTLLSLLAGLDLPTDGKITFDGNSLEKMNLDRYRRESISMIFQAFHLFPLLTVMENVCFPMELCGVVPKDAKLRASSLLESGANTQNIIQILCALAHDKGYCVIIVTHDLEIAEAADVSLRMRDGELFSYN